MAVRQRKQAELKYLANPNICKQCLQIVPIEAGRRLSETRRKQFCNHSCAAKYCNSRKPKKIKLSLPKVPKVPVIETETKETLFKNRATWQSARSLLRRHAAAVYWNAHNSVQCEHPGCGYTKHVEVCHKKPVSSFPGNTLITVINSLDNLIGLCPNHHWEFDHEGSRGGS